MVSIEGFCCMGSHDDSEPGVTSMTPLEELLAQSCRELEPRQGEPRLPNKEYSGLLDLISPYWDALAPLH